MRYKNCQEIQKNLSFFLEGLFDREEALEIQEHLASCQDCGLALEKERVFLALLRDHLTPPPAPPHVRSKIQEMLQGRRKSRGYLLWLIPPALAGGILIASLLMYNQCIRLDWAVDEHLALNNNEHSLDIRTDNPTSLKEWAVLQAGLPLHITPVLPQKIRIHGGRMVPAKNSQVVQVAFSSGQEVSSLFAVPREFAYPQGQAIAMNNLVFYVQKKKGHFVVAWRSVNAGYVLVSETAQGINRGCLLCHSNESMQLPPPAFLVEG